MRISRGWLSGLAEPRGAPRLVLVGLPGSGKSTVGPLVAARLGWEFVDLDGEIVRDAGRSIPEIFAAEGESGFRARERTASAALWDRGALVLAPGGGWVLDPVNLERIGGVATLVYLEVSPDVAAARIGGAGVDRPLLAGADVASRLLELFGQRESTYQQANHTVSTNSLHPDEVAALIVALASS
jgi:shikimate kinase